MFSKNTMIDLQGPTVAYPFWPQSSKLQPTCQVIFCRLASPALDMRPTTKNLFAWSSYILTSWQRVLHKTERRRNERKNTLDAHTHHEWLSYAFFSSFTKLFWMRDILAQELIERTKTKHWRKLTSFWLEILSKSTVRALLSHRTRKLAQSPEFPTLPLGFVPLKDFQRVRISTTTTKTYPKGNAP